MWLSRVSLHTHPDGALLQPAHCQHFWLVTVHSACLPHSFSQMSQIYNFLVFCDTFRSSENQGLVSLNNVTNFDFSWTESMDWEGNTTVKFFFSNNKINYWHKYSSQQLMQLNLCYWTGEVRATKPSLPFNLMQHYKSYKVELLLYIL